MKKKPKRQVSDKIIHIRIDETVHQKLKMDAALSKTTIQEIVESMLKRRFMSKEMD